MTKTPAVVALSIICIAGLLALVIERGGGGGGSSSSGGGGGRAPSARELALVGRVFADDDPNDPGTFKIIALETRTRNLSEPAVVAYYYKIGEPQPSVANCDRYTPVRELLTAAWAQWCGEPPRGSGVLDTVRDRRSAAICHQRMIW